MAHPFKTAIVTGGASGIGKATVKMLAGDGVKVYCADINEHAGCCVAEDARQYGGDVEFLKLDLTDEKSIGGFAEAVLEHSSSPDILVNAAGGGEIEPFLKNNPDNWDKSVALNFLGPVRLTHRLLGAMAEAGHGRIINIASDAGRVGSGGETVYAGAKGGVIAFTKSLAREVARHDITVNCVCPGPTDTPLLSTRPDKMKEALARAIPLRRFAKPEDIANAIRFFADDASGYITGQVLSVSGGLTMVD